MEPSPPRAVSTGSLAVKLLHISQSPPASSKYQASDSLTGLTGIAAELASISATLDELTVSTLLEDTTIVSTELEERAAAELTGETDELAGISARLDELAGITAELGELSEPQPTNKEATESAVPIFLSIPNPRFQKSKISDLTNPVQVVSARG